MLEPSSSEEDEDYEPSSGIQNNAKDNNLKPPVANGGPRPNSPNVTDGPGKGPGDRKGASSPSPSLNSEKGLTGKELEVSLFLWLFEKVNTSFHFIKNTTYLYHHEYTIPIDY